MRAQKKNAGSVGSSEGNVSNTTKSPDANQHEDVSEEGVNTDDDDDEEVEEDENENEDSLGNQRNNSFIRLAQTELLGRLSEFDFNLRFENYSPERIQINDVCFNLLIRSGFAIGQQSSSCPSSSGKFGSFEARAPGFRMSAS